MGVVERLENRVGELERQVKAFRSFAAVTSKMLRKHLDVEIAALAADRRMSSRRRPSRVQKRKVGQ